MNVLAPSDFSTRPTLQQVEIFFDLTCPWCYVAGARLTRSLGLLTGGVERFGPGAVPVLWRPFLLDQSIPPHGVARQAYFLRKFGSESRARRFYGVLAELGAEEGLRFAFDAMQTIPPTLDAHRILFWLRRFGVAEAVTLYAERLMRAHFAEGAVISDPTTLACLAVETGVASAAEVTLLLQGRTFMAEVLHEHAEAQRRGVTGVPCVVADGLAISGLQDEKVLDAILLAAIS